MSRLPIDLNGLTFGRLTVVRFVGGQGRGRPVVWMCRCECGKDAFVTSRGLIGGNTQSCGCLQSERRQFAVRKHGESCWHGHSASPEYRSWCAIIKRCESPADAGFMDYGGRGIGICQEWRRSFPAFLLAVGRRPSPKHSVDRINGNGHYEPGNVRWGTPEEQSRNRRTVVLFDIDDRPLGFAEAARVLAMPISSLRKKFRQLGLRKAVA
jgi:hypothetical protein